MNRSDKFCRKLAFEELEERRVLSGNTTSQGDLAIITHSVRDAYSLDGANLRIGVISGSYNSLDTADPNDGAEADVASGDLPGPNNPNGRLSPVIVRNNGATQIDEGRAMLQIIHDIAPGAELLFYGLGQFWNQNNLATAIRDLRDQGAQIIVDDLTSLEAPFFEDGPATAAVDEVVGEGVVYVTSAGNEGRRSYESEFTPGPVIEIAPGRFEMVHLFDANSGDYGQSISIPTDGGIGISFQWDESFFPPPVTNKFNIYLVDSTGQIERTGTGGTINPLRTLPYLNHSVNTDFEIMITYSGTVAPTQPVQLKYYDSASSSLFPEFTAVFNEYLTNSSTIFGHANSESAITVGAADYRKVGTLQPYSSAGGTPILFDTAGNRLTTPIVRQKPDIVGPDNGNTTFFGGEFIGQTPFIDPEDDNFPNFAGTSAAAPHVAGLVALLLQANPLLTPAEVKDLLTSTAIDMDDPHTTTFDLGFDFGTGYGFVDGMRAITKVLADSLPPKVMDVVVHSTVANHDPYELSRSANVGQVVELATNNYALHGTGAQLRTVPVGRINAIDIAFSELVDVDINDLIVTGMQRGDRPTAYTFTPPSASDLTARWGFDNPATPEVETIGDLGAFDYYLLSLDSASITADDNGAALDGEWTNPGKLFAVPTTDGDPPGYQLPEGIFTHADISRFPSGDGVAGGDFDFVISIVPGDANQDLNIGLADFNAVLNNFFTFLTEFIQGNYYGDSQVGLDDFNVVLNNFFTGLQHLVRLRGDLDNDGEVDQVDADALQALINANDLDGDLNEDGVADAADMTLLQNQFGRIFVRVV